MICTESWGHPSEKVTPHERNTMEELTLTDTIYLALAVRSMLEKDLIKADRDAYEKLFYKLRLSHKGRKIQKLFSTSMDEFMERISH